ncbi:hypothetical protein TrVE_jg10447 [Triparma verrucosa]|uniref:PA14 domain-containing protein n=1 Tax=Triparma verrucosa TaxID=1606542 RepID=A0A9W7CNW2_9STRA|nr:hypothetical protein TrVE_jg10447 [Triparma verrucosa]
MLKYLASSSNCADCAAGKYSLGSVCDECPGGKFSGAGSSECVGCDAGKYLVTAATSSKSTACADCSSGKYSGMSAASCTACSAGKKLIDSLEDSEEDACEQCESGKYATSSSSSCTSCSPGKYSGVGASSCNTCAAGKYGVRADTSSASVACQECETGKFSGEGSDTCSTCAPGKHLVKSDTADASIACESCIAGTKSSQTRAECQICEQGTYSGPNSNICQNCPSGKAGSNSSTDASLHAGSSSCISCAKGKFGKTEASVLCEVCPSGRFTSTITTTICTGCAVGKYLSDDRTDAALHDSPNDCISCIAGKFSKEGAPACTACGEEKSSPTASGVCSNCPKGKFDKLTDWSIHIEASSSEGVINLAEIEAMDADGVKITPLQATMLQAKPANPASKCVDSITTNYCLSDDTTRNNWLRIDYNAEDLPKLSRIVINNREDCCKDRIVGSRINVVGAQLSSNLGAYAYAIWSGTFDTAEATFDFYPTFDISSAVPSADCEDCPSQTYQDDRGQTSCKGCSPGKSSTNFDRGVQSEEDLSCVECLCMAGNVCDPTETNEDGTPQCLPCEAGKYASSLGGSTCLACQAGRYSVQASAFCSNCQSGEAPNDSRTACDKCDFGKVSISGDADCHSCDRSRGEISGEAGKSCERCNPGKFAKEDNSCETCEAGKFSDGLKSACVACGAGEVSLEGQSSCTPCNPGEVPNGDSSACRTCSAGEYSQFEFVDCESCNKPGEYSHEGAAFCDIVDPGEWPTLENDNDRFCYKDHFSLGGNDTCTKCTEGSHSEKGSTFCRSCPPGRFFVDSKDEVIVEANDGTRSSLTELFEMDNASTVTSAYSYFLAPESGQFYFEFKAGAKAELFIGKNETAKEGIVDIEIATSEYRRSDAIDLDEGEFYFLQLQLASDSPDTSLFHFSVGAILPNSEMLTPIRVYQYLSGRQHCEECEIGKHSLTGREPGGCTSCDSAKGFIASRKGMSNCEYCGVGKYASENVCKVCSAGTYSLGGSSCKFCLPNEYSGEDGASFCSHCPGGKIVNEANTGCDNCTAGQRSSPGDMKCSNCNPGYYSSTEGASSCTFCEGGKYSEVEENSTCTVCEAGRYSNNRRTGCSPCPGGTFSQEGASSCTVCSAGYFCPEEATETRSCPAGKYSGSGSSECSDCIAALGYVASNETSSSCTFCGAGTYADSTTNACIDCEPSKYSIGGTQSCSPCTMNTYSSKAKSASCSFCQAGKIVSLNGAGCVACSKGSVSSLGDFECRTCKKGEYSGEGSTCNLCDAGKISDDASAICTECEAGKYSNDNRTACIGCNPGSYAPKGHSSCTACGGGTYCEAQSGAPILCPKATFSRSGSSVCSPCNTTLEYADEQGLSSCKVCSLNQIANKNHTGCVCKNGFQPVFDKNNTLSDCVCAAGYFNDQGACKRCAAGQYKENAGNVECTSCNQQAVRGSFLTQSSILEASVLEASGELNWDEIPSAISPRNCSCSIGDFYLEEPPPDDPEFEGFGYCAPCPKGAKCSKPGMDVASLALEKGFWRSSKKSHKLVKCFAEEACPQQKQVTDGEDVEEIGNSTIDKSGQCREGHKGVLCNVCKNGYSKDVFGMCNACERTRVPLQTALFFVLSSILMVLLMWHFFVRRRRRDAVRRLRPNSKPRLFRQARTKFKILMSFYQIVGGYENVLQIRFPPAFENFSRLVSSFINLNWLVLVNFDCVVKTTFYSKLLIYTLFPIIIAGLIFLYMKGKVTMMKIQKKGSILFVYHFFTGSKGRQWHNGSIKGLKEEHDDKTAFIEYFETLALSSQEESGFCYVEFKDAFWYTWLAESKAKLEWRCDEGDGGPLNQGRAIFEIPLSIDEIQNYLINKECQPRRRVRELRVEANKSGEADRRVLYSVRRSKWPLNDRDCLVEQFTSDSSHEEDEVQILMETIYKRAVAQNPKANLNADGKADRKVNRKEDQRPRPRFSVLQTSKLSCKKRAVGPKFLKGAKCIVERSIMDEEIQSTKESNKLGYVRADTNINGFLLIPMEVQSSKDENVEAGPLTKVIYITSGDQTSNDVALSFGRRALKNGMKNMVDDLIDVWYLKMHPEAAAASTAPLRKARSKRKKFLNRFTSYGNDERDWSFGGKVKGWAKKFSSGMSRIPKDPMSDDSYNITKSNGGLANLDELGDVEMNSLEAGSRNPKTKAGLEVNEDGLLQLEQASIADSRPPAEDETHKQIVLIMLGTSVAVPVILS